MKLPMTVIAGIIIWVTIGIFIAFYCYFLRDKILAVWLLVIYIYLTFTSIGDIQEIYFNEERKNDQSE